MVKGRPQSDGVFTYEFKNCRGYASKPRDMNDAVEFTNLMKEGDYICTRPGQGKYGGANTGVTPVGAMIWNPIGTIRAMIMIGADGIIKKSDITAPAAWTNILATGVVAGTYDVQWDFCTYNIDTMASPFLLACNVEHAPPRKIYYAGAATYANITAANLGGGSLVDSCPVQWNDRIIGAKYNKAYYSGWRLPESWNALDYREVGDFGEPIYKIIVQYGSLIFVKRHSIHQAVGSGILAADSSLRKKCDFDVISRRGVADNRRGKIWLAADDGIYQYGDPPYKIPMSYRVQDEYKAILDRTNLVLFYHELRDQLWIHYKGGSTFDKCMVFDFAEDAVYKYDNFYIQTVAYDITGGEEGVVKPTWAASRKASDGVIYNIDTGTDDNGVAIAPSYKSYYFDCGSPETDKRGKKFHIWGYSAAAVTVTFYYRGSDYVEHNFVLGTGVLPMTVRFPSGVEFREYDVKISGAAFRAKSMTVEYDEVRKA